MKIYRDRTSVKYLADKDPVVLDLLRRHQKGKTEYKEHVHFCGVLSSAEIGTVVFVPLCVEKNAASCHKMMKVLSKYGREMEHRPFADDADTGNTGFLSVIKKLSDDFCQNGIYSERTKIHARETGKPDWPRTIKRMRALPTEVGDPVYSSLATTRSIDSRETLLGQIHAKIIYEIILEHGWWLDGLISRRDELRGIGVPAIPRRLWSKHIREFITGVFSGRGIRLGQLLISYLDANRTEVRGEKIFGLDDFHSVWERMLYCSIDGVEENFNSKLPFARYVPRESSLISSAIDRRMRTDIIACTTQGYALLDAKYYEANSSYSLPGWTDIAKQFVYEQALRKVVGADTCITNAFVFPVEGDKLIPYSSIEMMFSKDDRLVDGFPKIKIIGLNVETVMNSYLNGSKIVLIE